MRQQNHNTPSWSRLTIAYSAAISTGICSGLTLFDVSYKAMGYISSASLAILTCFLNSRARYALQRDEILYPHDDTDTFAPVHYSQRYCQYIGALSKQIAYVLLQLSNIAVNRYFLFVTAQEHFAANWRTPFGWTLLIIDILQRCWFGLLTDSFEACEQFAELPGNQRFLLPFYAPLLRFCKNASIVRVMRVIGSIEHAIVDDLFPWALLVSSENIQSIFTGSLTSKLFLGCVATGVALVLFILFFIQTNLFEGRFLAGNIMKLTNQLAAFNLQHEKTLADHPLLQKILHYTLYALGILHGAADGVPVYLVSQKLLKNHTALPKLAQQGIACTLGVSSLLATGFGSIFSEVHAAQRHLTPSKNSEQKQALLANDDDDFAIFPVMP